LGGACSLGGCGGFKGFVSGLGVGHHRSSARRSSPHPHRFIALPPQPPHAPRIPDRWGGLPATGG